MKRAVLVVFLAVLAGLYLYSAFARDRSRRYRKVPFKIGSVRRVLHAFLGIVLLLGVLLLLYGALLSTVAED
jgi:Ni,Fe-hydrogenase I cytochrome b subunit